MPFRFFRNLLNTAQEAASGVGSCTHAAKLFTNWARGYMQPGLGRFAGECSGKSQAAAAPISVRFPHAQVGWPASP